MRQIDISSIDQLLEELNGLRNNYFYRGHANAEWRLESSLERLVGPAWSPESAAKFEERSLDAFKSKFHLYDRENFRPDSKLAWLAIMQHYGVPTRLLDFTESPYVALYFALESYDFHRRTDLAVLAIDYTTLMQSSINYISERNPEFRGETRQSVYERPELIFENVVEKGSYDIAWVAEPKQLNARLDRQAGSFLLSGNRGCRIENVLRSPIYATTTMTKYRISKELCQGLFALLRKMNITSKSLYGDLEGLARYIRMEFQAYSL